MKEEKTEGPQNELRSRIKAPNVRPSMPELPMKKPLSDSDREWKEREDSAIRESREHTARQLASGQPVTKPSSSKKRATSTARTAKPIKKTSASTAKAKPLARGKGQPRDSRGRWVKMGAAIWSGTKATVKGVGKAVKGTAKAVKSVHKTVKRARAGYQKRARLEQRERNIALAKEEHKLGLRRKKVVRRRKR